MEEREVAGGQEMAQGEMAQGEEEEQGQDDAPRILEIVPRGSLLLSGCSYS